MLDVSGFFIDGIGGITMNMQILNGTPSCGSGPIPPENVIIPCSTCAPKMALTFEEEAILSRMRALKDEVRPIAARLKSLEAEIVLAEGYSRSILRNEWNQLSEELEEHRESWRSWERRLDEAIEKKLILLGHREARAN